MSLNNLLVSAHGPELSTYRAIRKHKSSLDPSRARRQFCRMAIGDRIARVRKDAGWSQGRLGAAVGQGQTTISSWERGRTEPTREDVQRIAAALRIDVASLEIADAETSNAQMVRVIGRVGANPDEAIIYTSASDVFDYAPMPPGGSARSVGLEVVGHSMRWVAEDGGLIYFERQGNPPSEDLLGYTVIVETEDGQVLVKRLLRGSAPGLYDLESQNGATLVDKRLVWAAEITAIIPARQARRIIRRGGEAA